MTEKTAKPATGKTPITAKKRGGRTEGTRVLLPKEKAEAVALWRSGKVTLDDLGTKFKKRPETFSRLFKKLGVTKGETVTEVAREMEKAASVAAVSDTEETLRRIKVMRDEHFRMSNGLAKMAWAQLVRAHTAGIPFEKLKESMATLKIAGDVIGNARKELFEVLDVEIHRKTVDEDDLPDLTVRELTQGEVQQLQNSTDLDEDIEVTDLELGDDLAPPETKVP